MPGSSMALLDGGQRLHLQHGPIDLVIGADATCEADRRAAFAAAAARFEGLLEGLVTELDRHRTRLAADASAPRDPVARRMYAAALPFCRDRFLTPMIAVAGAVADTILHAMRDTVPLRRAYVNNGGDIAVHLAADHEFAVMMAGHDGRALGCVRFGSGSGIGGIATSGTHGRSLSLGIADSVTVVAADAARADVTATLIANAVDLPGHPGIDRAPATRLRPDSDLGDRLVVTRVPPLDHARREQALAAGHAVAAKLEAEGHILGAALFLQGGSALTGGAARHFSALGEVEHA